MPKLKIILVFLFAITVGSGLQAQKRNQKKDKEVVGVSEFQRPQTSALFLDATKAKLLGDKKNAILLYSKVLEKDAANDAACYELAQLYFEQSDLATALQLAEKAVNLDQTNHWYKVLLVQLYKHANRQPEAIKLLQAMLKNDPANVDYLFEMADIYISENKTKDAIEILDKIENNLGVTEELSLQRQKLYLQNGDIDKAIAETEKLASGFPDNRSRYYAMAAEMFMAAKMPDKAFEFYKKIAQSDPSDPYIHISLSDYYRQKGDKQKALEELIQGFANPDLDIDTKIRVMLAYYSTTDLLNENKEQVLQLAQTLAKAHPNESKAHAILGDFYAQMNKYSEAQNEYLKVLASDSSKYSVWEGLMQCQAGMSDYKNLIPTSTRVTELFPLMPIPYLYRGTAQYQLKQFDNAIKTFNTGIKLVAGNNPLLSQFYGSLGDAYNEMKQYESSYQSYDKALLLDPQNSFVLNNYAYYLSLRGIHLDKAEEMAKKAIELNPGNTANLDTYGWILYKQKKYEQAREFIQKAITLSAKPDADVLEHMGDVLFKLGEKEKATALWQQALSLGGGSVNLQKKVKDQQIYE